jgi:hypothetical protein
LLEYDKNYSWHINFFNSAESRLSIISTNAAMEKTAITCQCTLEFMFCNVFAGLLVSLERLFERRMEAQLEIQNSSVKLLYWIFLLIKTWAEL